MTHASVGCARRSATSPCCRPPRAIGSQPWNAWERIAHDDTEVGVPGYYTVRFPETGVTAELTATTRTGVGRFKLPAQRPVRPVPRALWRIAGGQLPRDHPDRRGQHHDHRMGDQRQLLRQEQHLHGVFRDEVQPAVHLLRHLGWLRDLPRARAAASPYSGGYVEFPAGSDVEVRTAISYVGIDGARANLAAEGTTTFEPSAAAASSRMERRAVAHQGCRQRWRRYGDLLYLPVPIAVAPQHFQRRRRPIHRIRRRHPHRRRGRTPSTQTSPTGTPTDVWRPCRRCCSRSKPATWPSRWSMTRSKADRFRAGRWRMRDRRDDRRQRGAADREPLRVRRQGLRRQNGAALHGARGDHRRCRAATATWKGRASRPTCAVGLRARDGRSQRLDHAGVVRRRLRHLPIRRLRSATPRPPPHSRIGRNTGRTCSIPPPITSRRATRSDSSADGPGFVGVPNRLRPVRI